MAQVAIITASDSGIGKECALLLAQQGFDIGITWHSDEAGAKDTAREVVSHGVRAEIVQLDLGNLPEGALALGKLIQRLGRIDVLVNNAGAMAKSPFLDMAFDQWRKIFTVDVDGGFMLANPQFKQEQCNGVSGYFNGYYFCRHDKTRKRRIRHGASGAGCGVNALSGLQAGHVWLA